MSSKLQGLVLTKSQAACLIAVRHGKDSKTKIAIDAKLDLRNAATALRMLTRLGLAQQGRTERWHTTGRGQTCRFKTVPDRARRNSDLPGPGVRRLLKLLDRPMRGHEIAEQLGLSRQRVHQLVVKLHAQGHVTFGNPDQPFWMVIRTGDKTPLLSRDEARVLSAVPRDYATTAVKIRLAVRMTETKVGQILERLTDSGFVEARTGLDGNQAYRLTATGLTHPQRGKAARNAQAPRLPVESDRVRTVLAAIDNAGSLRIKDARDALEIPHNSMNALMQYLKRKLLVQKTGSALDAPYCLTDKGYEVLAEITRRHAA